MSINGIPNNKIADITKLRDKPLIYPYHPLPSVEDPVDYTNMLRSSIFGYTFGYVGQKDFYPPKGTLLENPGYGLIRNPAEYVRDGDGKKYRGISL